MKKILILTFVVLLVSCSEYKTEKLSDGTLEIIKYKGHKKDIVIPQRIGKRDVKVIGKYSFFGKELRSVFIPQGITTIDNFAFSDNKLVSVTLPDSLTYIGWGAFSYNEISELSIPNNVTYIGNSAFSNNKLTSVIISESVIYIGSGAFVENNISSVFIPDNVFSISGVFDEGVIFEFPIKEETPTDDNKSDESKITDKSDREVIDLNKLLSADDPDFVEKMMEHLRKMMED